MLRRPYVRFRKRLVFPKKSDKFRKIKKNFGFKSKVLFLFPINPKGEPFKSIGFS